MATDFDRRAPDWDNALRANRADSIAAALRGALPLRRPLTGMEYGCGTGLVGLRLADAFDALLLADSSAGMLAQADKKLRTDDLRHVTTRQLDLLVERPAEFAVDCVFLSMVLHHIPQTGAILDAFYRAILPGGRLLIVDLHPVADAFHRPESGFDGHSGFEPAALAAALETAGFGDVAWKTIFHGQKDVAGQSVPYSLFLLRGSRL